jgi:predicted RNase H-like nuclease
MPMGFADCAEPGGRTCEREARALLPGRTSSVFATPCRAVLEAESYADALALNRASSMAARGISKQCWNIVPRMREVDALLRERPALRRRIVEAHPELAFARMNGGAPVISPKRGAEGRRLRLALLARHGFDGLDGVWTSYPRDVVAADDMLDAAAVCRTATLIHDGDGRTLPARPPKDAHGLPMRICW